MLEHRPRRSGAWAGSAALWHLYSDRSGVSTSVCAVPVLNASEQSALHDLDVDNEVGVVSVPDSQSPCLIRAYDRVVMFDIYPRGERELLQGPCANSLLAPSMEDPPIPNKLKSPLVRRTDIRQKNYIMIR